MLDLQALSATPTNAVGPKRRELSSNSHHSGRPSDHVVSGKSLYGPSCEVRQC